MAFEENKSDKGTSPEYKEDIPSIHLSHRMDLPSDHPEDFEEVQPFSQTWLWILMGVETVALILPLIITGQPWYTFLMMAIIMVITLSLLGSLKLQTGINNEGIHYRMTPFHRKDQFIPWSAIDSVQVRQYSPIGEYGGWGIRFGLNGRAYNVKGNMGIQLVKKDGKRILIGTQRPEEAQQRLERIQLTV
ncbi:MAG: hypothetical protein M3R25_15420 [Bacteroidota bacterium]|nr:hypothetical protein [Bacteroidota bacterium]